MKAKSIKGRLPEENSFFHLLLGGIKRKIKFKENDSLDI